MKAKDTPLLNNTITQNPKLPRRALFWHVASQILPGPKAWKFHSKIRPEFLLGANNAIVTQIRTYIFRKE